MSTKAISLMHTNRAPALAAAFVVCLSIAPNTLANATNTAAGATLPHNNSPKPVHENGQVLGSEDVSLYQSIFEAQGHRYWKEADLMISHLHDKRLLGHVLADRYLKQAPSLPEVQAWLANYRDLPEADDIYQLAKTLPGVKNAKLTRPVAATDISGNGFGYEIGSGFRNKESGGAFALSLPARRAIIRIQSAMRQGHPDKAKAMLEEALQQNLLTGAALAPLQSRLAAGYFYNGDSEEARRLTEVSYLQKDARALWVSGLSNYRLRHYGDASSAFVALAERDDLSDSDHAAASFWAYRTLLKANKKSEATHWLEEAATEPRSFYGLLASNLNGQSAEKAWSWRLPEFNKHAYDMLAGIPAGARAMALVQIGQNDLAEAELRSINPQGRRPLQEAMLAVSETNHMSSLTLRIGGIATNEDGKPYDAALYPVPQWQPKDGFHVDRALMYALMRHESHFDPTAVSSQGACGLMQLMPATAERMSGKSSKHGRSKECPDQFFDPAINLGLGQSYVRHLADQPMIGDNLLLLLTAYNGGPGRLSQRSGTEVDADPLLFMESLPAQETHDYVQQVLMQYWTYRARLHQPLNSLTQLARGEWPRFALRDTGGVREAAADVRPIAVAANTTIH